MERHGHDSEHERGHDQRRDQDRRELVRVADPAREPARIRVRAELLRGRSPEDADERGQERAAEVGAQHPDHVLTLRDRGEDDHEEQGVLREPERLDPRRDRIRGPQDRGERPRDEEDGRVRDQRMVAEDQRRAGLAVGQPGEPRQREDEAGHLHECDTRRR
jgi:hypothetical protein